MQIYHSGSGHNRGREYMRTLYLLLNFAIKLLQKQNLSNERSIKNSRIKKKTPSKAVRYAVLSPSVAPVGWVSVSCHPCGL